MLDAHAHVYASQVMQGQHPRCYRLAMDHAAGFVNARGTVPVVRLHDIPNHVREVTLHGVRHGAAMALAAAQARSAIIFGFFPMVFWMHRTSGSMSAWLRIS